MTRQLTDNLGSSGHGRELGAHDLEELFYLKPVKR
jgi:hypothetical protein